MKDKLNTLRRLRLKTIVASLGFILIAMLPKIFSLYKAKKKNWFEKLSEKLVLWFKYKI